MCCKLLGIKEIKKQSGEWCPHCAKGVGCKVYEERPPSCYNFECLWLQSQDQPGAKLGPEFRPDKCKVVLHPTTNDKVMAANVDPGYPMAWKRPDVHQLIAKIAEAVGTVVVGWGTTQKKIEVHRGSLPGVVTNRTIFMSQPDENGMQWFDPDKPDAHKDH
jgi:hypothetical protein